MPTTRPRHTITETDEVAAALDQAARRWPADAGSRGRLLVRLIEAGHGSIVDDEEKRRAARREAIRRTAGVLTGTYPPGYLDEMRRDWPE